MKLQKLRLFQWSADQMWENLRDQSAGWGARSQLYRIAKPPAPIYRVRSTAAAANMYLHTPGLHKPRSRAGDYMVKVVADTVSEVHAAALIASRLPISVRHRTSSKPPRTLPAVFNKIDTVKHEDLLAVIVPTLHSIVAVVPVLPFVPVRGSARFAGRVRENCTGRTAAVSEDMVSDSAGKQMAAELFAKVTAGC